MPELPEVESFRRYFDSTSLYQEIEDVKVLEEGILEGVSREELVDSLRGGEFTSTRRHGKYLFARANKRWLVLHFGMTGYLEYSRGEAPEHTRVKFDFSNGYRLAYVSVRKLGRVSLREVEKFLKAKRLGPDALRVSLPSFRTALQGRRGRAKYILMNQKVISGIGNIYSDEILFQAGIHPGRKVDELTAIEVEKLYHKMREVLLRVVRRKGDLEKLPLGYLIPHRDEDESCPCCGGSIKRFTLSGRNGYFCPRCQ